MVKITGCVISPPHTYVFWDDGMCTSCKYSKDGFYDEEKGVLYAIAKKFVPTSDILKAYKEGRDFLKENKPPYKEGE